jgi:hypothetical protein
MWLYGRKRALDGYKKGAKGQKVGSDGFALRVNGFCVAGLRFWEATEKGIYYTSLRESTLHNNPPEFSYSDECSTLRRMFAF